MNDTIDQAIPEGKIFKDTAFWAGTFLGGPLVAGYLFSENFKVLGQPEKVKPTWMITIVVTILIFGGIFLIPDDINIPNQIVPITYTAAAFGLFKLHQEEKAKEHLKLGGSSHNWARVFGVGILGLLITTLPIFIIVFTIETIDQSNITTKTYGTTLKHQIDFDQSNITAEEIDEIAEGFFKVGFFDFSASKYVFVVKNGNCYEISTSVISGTENNTEAIELYNELRDYMDHYLPNNTVEIRLVVDYLDNVVTVLK